MSLLNDMLKDLAKQKPLNQKPYLTATMSRPVYQWLNRYVFGGAAFVFLLSIVIFKTVGTVKNTQLAKTNPDKLLSALQADALKPSITLAAQQSAIAHSQAVTSTELTVQSGQKHGLIKDGKFAKIKEKRMVKDSKSTAAQLATALQALEQGQINKAKTLLQTVVAAEPSNIQANQQLASIYLYKSQFTSADKVINLGLEYAPENPDLIAIKAKILVAKGRSTDALQLLKNDHPSIVEHPDFYATLASILAAEGQMAEAGTYYKSLLKVDPNEGKYWLGYAASLESNHQIIEARKAYQRALENSGNQLAVHQQAEKRLKTLHG